MKFDRIFFYRGNGTAAYLLLATFAVFLLAVDLSPGQTLNLLGDEGGDDEDDSKSLLNRKIHLDMMYGTDDYFGENTDLSYADRVTPSGKTTPDPTPTTTTTLSSDQDEDDDDDDDDKDSGDSGSSGGSDDGDDGDSGDDGGDDGGGGGDDPPPPPPPPPDDPDCPD